MFGWSFGENVYGTLLAAAIIGASGWLATRFWRSREARLLPSRVSLAFEETDQFRRTDSTRYGQRTVYLLGVINNTARTLRGVQCFVVSVEHYIENRKRPLQPLGAPSHAERIDVPPSTNNQPSAYFQFVDDYDSDESAGDLSKHGFAYLCVGYGDSQLPFATHVTVSLEGDGFKHEAAFAVNKRIRSSMSLTGEFREVQAVPLTIKRLK